MCRLGVLVRPEVVRLEQILINQLFIDKTWGKETLLVSACV